MTLTNILINVSNILKTKNSNSLSSKRSNQFMSIRLSFDKIKCLGGLNDMTCEFLGNKESVLCRAENNLLIE